MHQLFYEPVFKVTGESFAYDISPGTSKSITAGKNINELNISVNI